MTVDPDSCVLWPGTRTQNGYGLARRHPGATPTTAHRLAYEKHHGPIPEAIEIDHLCGNRACVELTHLEAVTHSENMRRSATTHHPVTGWCKCPMHQRRRAHG